MLTVLFMLAISLVTAVNPELGTGWATHDLAGTPGGHARWREVLVLFVIVIGGLYLGLATPVESAAFGAVGALLFQGQAHAALAGTACRPRRNGAYHRHGLFIVTGADLFGYFMALSQMPMQLAAWSARLQAAPSSFCPLLSPT